MKTILETTASDCPKRGWMIGLTFLIGMVFMILPLPHWAVWLRPNWVLLILIYWTLSEPNRVGMGVAWMVGFLLDILCVSMLGEHAFGYVWVAYFCTKFHLRINALFFFQKAMTIFLFILFYQGMLFWIQGLIGQLPDYRFYWLSTLTTLLAWPWVFILLRDYHKKIQRPA